LDHLKHNGQWNIEASDIGSIAIPWCEQKNKKGDGKIDVARDLSAEEPSEAS
jgi:hypothetical protein